MRANAGLALTDTENRPKLRSAPHGYAATEDVEEWYADCHALIKEKKERLMGTR